MTTIVEPEVQVRFTTRLQDLDVPDMSVMLPSKFTRKALSEVVSRLCNQETPGQFDFLLDGRYLRSSLRDYLEKNHLSMENVLTIEVVKSFSPPNSFITIQHDDWISDISVLESKRQILSSSYDGSLRIYDKCGDLLSSIKAHAHPVKSAKWFDSNRILSASADHTIRMWFVNADQKTVNPEVTYHGHSGSVETLAVIDESLFASGSWDASIKLWSVSGDAPSKRQRRNHSATLVMNEKGTMVGSTGPVLGLAINKNDNSLVSCSLDNVIRGWDVETEECIWTKSLPASALSIDSSHLNGLILCGCTDGSVKIFDSRVSSATETMNVLSLLSGTSWISSVSWTQTNSFHFVSGSHDGSVKVWDIRSTSPLHLLNRQMNGMKIFSTLWPSDSHIYFGGEDGILHISSENMEQDKQ